MIFTFSASNTSLHPPLGRGRKDWASGTWFEVFPWETNILIWQSISGRKGWEQQIWPEWVGSKCDLSICCIRSRATDHKVAWSIPVLVVSNPAYIPIYAICTPHSDIFQSRERDQNCFVAARCNTSLWHHNNMDNKGSFEKCIRCCSSALTLGTASGSPLIIAPSLWEEEGG